MIESHFLDIFRELGLHVTACMYACVRLMVACTRTNSVHNPAPQGFIGVGVESGVQVVQTLDALHPGVDTGSHLTPSHPLLTLPLTSHPSHSLVIGHVPGMRSRAREQFLVVAL